MTKGMKQCIYYGCDGVSQGAAKKCAECGRKIQRPGLKMKMEEARKEAAERREGFRNEKSLRSRWGVMEKLLIAVANAEGYGLNITLTAWMPGKVQVYSNCESAACLDQLKQAISMRAGIKYTEQMRDDMFVPIQGESLEPFKLKEWAKIRYNSSALPQTTEEQKAEEPAAEELAEPAEPGRAADEPAEQQSAGESAIEGPAMLDETGRWVPLQELQLEDSLNHRQMAKEDTNMTQEPTGETFDRERKLDQGDEGTRERHKQPNTENHDKQGGLYLKFKILIVDKPKQSSGKQQRKKWSSRESKRTKMSADNEQGMEQLTRYLVRVRHFLDDNLTE
ncbi:uncharacterized protein [Watersipora subatra]|uniref:uncharacterized protein n=1 Tax=Watersipora subatra TaxID=2589382 RepID=UPI00355BEE5E